MRRLAAAGSFAVVAALAGGCASDDGAGTDQDAGRSLDVLAASSLTEVFESLAETFESEHPGVEVRLVLESSTTLANQVVEGAPADVLATADEKSMQLVLDSGDAATSELFATNELVLVTPKDNPALITDFEDLDDPSVSYVACVETAPCGALAARLLEENDVTAAPRSLEVDVKAVLAKVVADEADAGLVYATDAFAAAGDVTTWPIPGSDDALTVYPIAVVEGSADQELAEEWVDLVLSAEGQDVLEQAGFGPPDAPAPDAPAS